MLLPFLLFGALSIASAGTVADWSVINPNDYKHFPVYEMIKAVNSSDGADAFVLMCQFAYCHGENNKDCSKHCDAMQSKWDANDDRSKKIDNSTKPFADLESCKKGCEIDCGKNVCDKECASLCAHHFSFDNRKEYEAEFYDIVSRLRKTIDS